MKLILASLLALGFPGLESAAKADDITATRVKVALALVQPETNRSVLDDETARWLARLKPVAQVQPQTQPQKPTQQAQPQTPQASAPRQQPVSTPRPVVTEQRYYQPQPAYQVVPQGYFYQPTIQPGYFAPGMNCISGS